MSVVVTLEGYRPSSRYDGHAWVGARIEESSSPAGPWAAIDVVELDPLDADPTQPGLRNFTTSATTLPSGYYRVVFLDGLNGEQPTDAVFNGPPAGPSAATVRLNVPAQYDWNDSGYPAPTDGGRDPLTLRVEAATAELALTIGRPYSALSAEERPIGDQAVSLIVLYGAMGASRAALAVQGKPWIKSFTAGSYSQQRFSPAELAGAGGNANADVISKLHPWRQLALDLWLLATPAKREEWTAVYTGEVAAAGGIFAVDVGGGGEGLWPYGALWPS